jgi:hypothetical protein
MEIPGHGNSLTAAFTLGSFDLHLLLSQNKIIAGGSTVSVRLHLSLWNLPHLPFQELGNELPTYDLASRLQAMVADEGDDGHADDLLSVMMSFGDSSPMVNDHDSNMLWESTALVAKVIPNEVGISNKSDRVRKRNVEQSRKNRSERRKRARTEACASGQPPPIREDAQAKHTATTDFISTPMATAKAFVTQNGYIALNAPLGQEEKEISDGATLLESLKGKGFKYQAWEGV